MPKAALLFSFFVLTCFRVLSQEMPKEGSKLNYRLIGFSFPLLEKGDKYKIEIAKGIFDTEDSFQNNIIRTELTNKQKVIAEVPFWGCDYTWRVVFTNRNSDVIKSPVYHFSTDFCPEVDTANVRLRVLQSSEKYKEAFCFLDNNRVLYDMKGKPVWFLPHKFLSDAPPRDIKLSPQGTITFLLKEDAYEIDYDGNVLWKGPNNGAVSGDSMEHYHHEFTRLDNGNYMVLGNESVLMEKDKQAVEKGKHTALFGTLIEYDAIGNVIWSWKSSQYFFNSDLYQNLPLDFATDKIDLHDNSFYFDKATKCIYVSFKNISRIIKLSYPDGKILNTYGEIYKQGTPESGNGLYCHQHSVKRSKNGYIYFYNNNSCKTSLIPSVILMQEPGGKTNKLKKIWEYVCSPDEPRPNISASGGNVIELPDNSLFVSTAVPESKLFIINRDKKILWSALPEIRSAAGTNWYITGQYRASIITDRNAIESLVWGDKSK